MVYTIILLVLVAVIGFFGLKASRYGPLNFAEIPIFAVLCAGLAGYIIFLIYKIA
ncbi:MAG: hypothetical protein BWY60_00241 [Actinobacteria bacterium ADurb.Bin346]|nr:MAG: hypothetical protein BWY60_00241 [Actinobacteria bacterium ADurb.Bin346]